MPGPLEGLTPFRVEQAFRKRFGREPNDAERAALSRALTSGELPPRLAQGMQARARIVLVDALGYDPAAPSTRPVATPATETPGNGLGGGPRGLLPGPPAPGPRPTPRLERTQGLPSPSGAAKERLRGSMTVQQIAEEEQTANDMLERLRTHLAERTMLEDLTVTATMVPYDLVRDLWQTFEFLTKDMGRAEAAQLFRDTFDVEADPPEQKARVVDLAARKTNLGDAGVRVYDIMQGVSATHEMFLKITFDPNEAWKVALAATLEREGILPGSAQATRLQAQKAEAMKKWVAFSTNPDNAPLSFLGFFNTILQPTLNPETGVFSMLAEAPKRTLEQRARSALLRTLIAEGKGDFLSQPGAEKWLDKTATAVAQHAMDSAMLQDPDASDVTVAGLVAGEAQTELAPYLQLDAGEFNTFLLAQDRGPFKTYVASLGLAPEVSGKLREDEFELAFLHDKLRGHPATDLASWLTSAQGQAFTRERLTTITAPDFTKADVRERALLQVAVQSGALPVNATPDQLAAYAQLQGQLETRFALDQGAEKPMGFSALAQQAIAMLPSDSELKQRIALQFGARPPGMDFFTAPVQQLHQFTGPGATPTFYGPDGKPVTDPAEIARRKGELIAYQEKLLKGTPAGESPTRATVEGESLLGEPARPGVESLLGGRVGVPKGFHLDPSSNKLVSDTGFSVDVGQLPSAQTQLQAVYGGVRQEMRGQQETREFQAGAAETQRELAAKALAEEARRVKAEEAEAERERKRREADLVRTPRTATTLFRGVQ